MEGNHGFSVSRLLMDEDSSGLISFAAFGSIKENPDRKVIAEVLKTMCDTGRGKQNIVRGNCLPRAIANELSAALRYDV